MDIKNIVSPVTGSSPVQQRDTISVKDIKDLYATQFKLDVSRSFKNCAEVKVLECVKTGYRFFYPYEIAGDASFYEELQVIMDKNEMYYRPWGYDHQFAYDQIKKGNVVLDVGCGSGNFLCRIKEKTNAAIGLEFNNAAIEKCKKLGLEVYPDTIERHAQQRPEFYDVVCLFQVLEHISDVKPFLEACLKTLKKDGKLIIGVPNNEPYMQGYNKYAPLNLPPHHMGMWNINSFKAIQPVFQIKLIDKAYEAKGRLMLDAYFRAKYWANVKSLIHHHSIGEKIRMTLLALPSLLMSLMKKISKGIYGGFIVVVFEK